MSVSPTNQVNGFCYEWVTGLCPSCLAPHNRKNFWDPESKNALEQVKNSVTMCNMCLSGQLGKCVTHARICALRACLHLPNSLSLWEYGPKSVVCAAVLENNCTCASSMLCAWCLFGPLNGVKLFFGNFRLAHILHVFCQNHRLCLASIKVVIFLQTLSWDLECRSSWRTAVRPGSGTCLRRKRWPIRVQGSPPSTAKSQQVVSHYLTNQGPGFTPIHCKMPAGCFSLI